MKQDCALIVFAKAPVPGYAKTRLARVLGDEAAARLAARMLEDTLARAMASQIGPVELCCAPDTSHAQFQQAASTHGISLTLQGEGDLGVRMDRALTRCLQNHRRAVLIGTDAPDLDAAYLLQAATLLLTQPAVFGPAFDGGYVLVGLAQPMPLLFKDIAWSTDQVMAQTGEKLDRLGVRGEELPMLRDIDEPDDLQHLPGNWLA